MDRDSRVLSVCVGVPRRVTHRRYGCFLYRASTSASCALLRLRSELDLFRKAAAELDAQAQVRQVVRGSLFATFTQGTRASTRISSRSRPSGAIQAPSAFDLQCPEPSHCHHFNRVYTGVDSASFPPGGVIQRPRKIQFFSSSPTSPHTSCVDAHGARVVRRLLGPRRLTMRERTWRPSGSPVWAPAP